MLLVRDMLGVVVSDLLRDETLGEGRCLIEGEEEEEMVGEGEDRMSVDVEDEVVDVMCMVLV